MAFHVTVPYPFSVLQFVADWYALICAEGTYISPPVPPLANGVPVKLLMFAR